MCVQIFQRPFGQRVANIGTWQNALGFLGLAAVIVNCALIGLSGQVSRLWPGLTSTQTIILIVALEHVMIGLRSALTWLLPELPSWLAAEIARAEHCRREMQCKGTSPRPTPPSPPSNTSVSQSNYDQDIADIDNGNDHRTADSQIADDIIFYHIAPISPKFKKSDDQRTYEMGSGIEADVSINECNKEITPDSPVLQVITSDIANYDLLHQLSNCIDFEYCHYFCAHFSQTIFCKPLNHQQRIAEYPCKIYP